MATHLLLVTLLCLSCFAPTSYAVTFSSLQKTLLVASSPIDNNVLKAGEEQITVTWSMNRTFPAGTDSNYETVHLKLCFAPISQVERTWRRTENDLEKDKTCIIKIADQVYTSSANQSYTWTIAKDVPSATYFVRVYAMNSQGHEVAYGQSTNSDKTANLFQIQAISGRHVSLDIASACFSGFSVVSLVFFFYMEKRKARMSSK